MWRYIATDNSSEVMPIYPASTTLVYASQHEKKRHSPSGHPVSGDENGLAIPILVVDCIRRDPRGQVPTRSRCMFLSTFSVTRAAVRRAISATAVSAALLTVAVSSTSAAPAQQPAQPAGTVVGSV